MYSVFISYYYLTIYILYVVIQLVTASNSIPCDVLSVGAVISCCDELSLQKNMDIDVEIQFQMNRLIFSQMHYAIDQLDCIELLFPEHNKIMRAGAGAGAGPAAASSSLLQQSVSVSEETGSLDDLVRRLVV